MCYIIVNLSLLYTFQHKINKFGVNSNFGLFYDNYLAHVIEQPNFRIPNPQYLQRNFCYDFFNDSENTF